MRWACGRSGRGSSSGGSSNGGDGWQRMLEVEKGKRAKAASGEVLGKREVWRARRGGLVCVCVWKEEAAAVAAAAEGRVEDELKERVEAAVGSRR